MNYATYSAINAVNWSTLKHLRESPLAYQHALQGADRDSTARAAGRAIHALVFEPELFQADFAIYADGDRRGKAWKAFKADHAGKTILKANEADAVSACANAVRVHPLVAPYLVGGKFEQTALWNDPKTGLACKARMDWVIPSKRVLIDLKSTTTIDAFRFGRIAARLGYHSQLTHYANGCAHAFGWETAEVVIVAVESAAPYDIGVFVLDEDALYAGQEEVAGLMARLLECRSSGKWPGRYTEKAALTLPAYVFGDEDEADAMEGITVGTGE